MKLTVLLVLFAFVLEAEFLLFDCIDYLENQECTLGSMLLNMFQSVFHLWLTNRSFVSDYLLWLVQNNEHLSIPDNN